MPSTVLPLGLETLIVHRGPVVLARMVEEAGGLRAAARQMSVASGTVARWTYGVTQRRHVGDVHFRGLWPGYPSPFPQLDRVVEHLVGPGHSYLGYLAAKEGLKAALVTCQHHDGFGLDALVDSGPRHPHGPRVYTWEDIRQGLMAIRAPRSSRRRWYAGLQYPASWTALDRLAQGCGWRSWVGAVLEIRPETLRRPIPLGAVGSLLRRLVEEEVPEP